MPSPPPILHIESLSHHYGQRVALDSISLDIAPGEIFGLLGPNGSGKTTLFRILTTMLPVSEGRVMLADIDLSQRPADARRLIGVVFQSPSLDKQLTTEENLRHHGHLYGLSGLDLEQRIDAMLGRFNLADRRKDFAGKLSGGLRRRIELAKGLLPHPRILLMDEPSTGLDPAAHLEMWDALLSARRQDGVTVLLTTHLMDEADKCDRLAILDRGKIAALGTPQELKETIGGDVITLTGPDLPDLARRLKEKLNTSADPTGDSIRFERPRTHEFIPQLVEALGGGLASVSVGRPTLEDVFIHVTGRRFKDA